MPTGTQKSGSSYSGGGQSSVGQPSVYEAGDQRNEPQSAINQRERYHEGQKGSHRNLDSSTCLSQTPSDSQLGWDQHS
jgi:hypothetical protein